MSEMPFIPGDTYSDEGPQCPYCGCQITADEPHYYDECNYEEDECPSCEKTFKVTVCQSVDWSCERMEDAHQ